jgi:restriction system protein
MSIPMVQPLLLPILRAIADGNEHQVKGIRERVVEELKLTDNYVKPVNPKTGQSHYVNHSAWALVYLEMGKAITKKREGEYQIAERGKEILKSGVKNLTIHEAKNA